MNWETAPDEVVRTRLLRMMEDALKDPPADFKGLPMDAEERAMVMDARAKLLRGGEVQINFLTNRAPGCIVPPPRPPRILRLGVRLHYNAAEFLELMKREEVQAATAAAAAAEARSAAVTLAVTFGVKWHGDQDEAPLKEWLVEKTLGKVGTALLAGQWGVYKTFMAFDLAAAVMTMTPFAGRAVNRQGGVLFIACEGQDEVRVRLEGVAREKVAGLPIREGVVTVDPAHMPFAWIETCPPLTADNAADEISKIVKAAQAVMFDRFGLPIVLVIIDTMTAAADFKDASGTSEAARVMKVLGGVAHEANALVLAVDHFGKDASVGVRNSSAKEGSGDSVLALLANRDIEGNVTKPRLAIRKARGAPTGEVIPFATRQVVIDEKDGDNAITTLIIEWRPTEPLDDESAGDEKQWAKGLVIFMKALGSAVADTGRRVRPFADGSEVDGAQRDSVRAEFMETYPADNQKTKDRAFARAVGDALDKGLMGSGLVDGATFFWRL